MQQTPPKSDILTIDVDTTSDGLGQADLITDSGSNTTDDITNDNTPTIEIATTEESNVGDIVTLYDGDVAIETHTITQADLDAGKVTVSITVSDENALSDGNHVFMEQQQ